ncbi:MAG: response regulator transcription factor [Candidatus Bipolaricaulota bacterium]|nr:response regulator transcription factor [Candidatus Bipolaricaulota bacterium]MBS3791737.1 response regulator transcription factor [Candidatus Bipolaricaulota bacterium]
MVLSLSVDGGGIESGNTAGNESSDKDSKKEKLTLVLADDHTLVRQGIETLLSGNDTLEIVGQAGDGYEALDLVDEHEPDIAIIDISMPRLNGLEAARKIEEKGLGTDVIFLSMYDDEGYIRRAIKTGASGYLLKEDAIDELEEAIESVRNGYHYMSPPILTSLVEMTERGLKAIEPDVLDQLTAREREILQLIAEDNSNKEIAEILSRSVETVRTHRANLMEKLDVHSAKEIREFALREGVIKDEEK